MRKPAEKKVNRKGALRIAVISRESDDKSLDVAMLEKELLSRGHEVRTLCKLLAKDSKKAAISYAGEIARQMRAINWADVVILDTYCIPVSMTAGLRTTKNGKHKKGPKVIQMWHALAAVKKFGWQTVGRADGTSERTARIMKMHEGYDYVVAPSDATAEHFAEAFRTDRSKIVKLGLPRIDYIKEVTGAETGSEGSESPKIRNVALEKIYKKYPELRHDDSLEKNKKNCSTLSTDDGKQGGAKQIVLYAPTFRRGSAPDVKGLAEALDPGQYTLVVKLHPLYRAASVNAVEADAPAMIPDDNDKISTFDWLSIADIIITDYSSLVVEASLANKPLYFYTYDIESYKRTTGLNMDFSEETIGKYAFRNAADLATELSNPYDFKALYAFRDKYIEADSDDSSYTSHLADFIESIFQN